MASSQMETDADARAYPSLPPPDDDYEWMYTMRRSMQEIVPGVFLGPYASASKSSLETMKSAGLTHVVCVQSPAEAHLVRANHTDHFQYLLVPMEESQQFESVIPKVKTVSTFIDNCLSMGGKVLIYGMTGMSRSATLMIGYIMSKYGVSFKKACKYVQSKRFCIAVGESFRRQLTEYEPIYLAMHAMGVGQSGGDEQYRLTKRKIDEVDEEAGEENEGTRRTRMEGVNDGADDIVMGD